MDDTIAMHDTTAFGQIGLGIAGVGSYNHRALLLPCAAAVVSNHEQLGPYVKWLRQVGLGPREVIAVEGMNLYEGLNANPSKMDMVSALLRQKCRLQVFNTTDETMAFCECHGINTERELHSPPLAIARTLADKIKFRALCADIGLAKAFPKWTSTKDPQKVMSLVKEWLAKPKDEVPFVFVKRSDLAGGHGMARVYRGDNVEEKVVAFLRGFQKNEVIVEAWNQSDKRPISVVTLEDPGLLKQTLEKILGEKEGARIEHFIVRRTVLVSGIGSERIRRDANLDQACTQFIRSHCENEIIVEVGYVADSYAVQYLLGGGKAEFLGVTQQLMDGPHHVGNVLTRELRPDRLSKEAYVDMKTCTGQIVKRIQQEYDGPLGLDLIVVTGNATLDDRPLEGRIFLTEANPRPTASFYPREVIAQVSKRHTDGVTIDDKTNREITKVNVGAKMYNAVPVNVRTFEGIKATLGKKLFDGKRGVIPFNLPLMDLAAPQCGLIAVGDTLEQAESLMKDGIALLAP